MSSSHFSVQWPVVPSTPYSTECMTKRMDPTIFSAASRKLNNLFPKEARYFGISSRDLVMSISYEKIGVLIYFYFVYLRRLFCKYNR